MRFDRYDPDRAPNGREWLALDESQRLSLVVAHHAASAERPVHARLHAALHVVVENQLALGDPPAVGETLTRLQQEGLSRHDAIHAMGGAVSELLFDLSNTPAADPKATTQLYVERLARLTASAVVDSGE